MKSTMESHVATVRKTMFRQACDSVKGQLEYMCAEVERSLTVIVEDILAKLQHDYLATLASGRAEASPEVPEARRVLRDQVRHILEDADSRFEKFCSSTRGPMSATALASEQEEDNIAQQQQDGVSNLGTKICEKAEPV